MTNLFELPDELGELLERAEAFAKGELSEIAAQTQPGEVDRDLLEALARNDLLPRAFPSSAGGSHEGDVSALELCVLREGLARGCARAETALALQGLGSYPILQSGDDEQIARWIPDVAAGRAVAAFALTEPHAGTDAAALSLRAEPEGEGWRLSGAKKWISNAPQADLYTVFARTTEGAGSRGVSAFVVQGEAAGLSGERLDLVAPHPIGTLIFDGVHVGREALLGELDEGFKVAMRTLDLFRPSVGAFAVGMAQAALDAAVAHAGRREAFGQELRSFQAVSQQLADMATEVEAARLLVYSAAARYDEGSAQGGLGRTAGSKPVTKRSAMAKLFATEAAQRVIDAAIQIHGAAALEKGHLLEELYRDVRATRIYEGTSEIQREIIARELYR
ncbi:MAG: acyl-CoA dehydrogenase family protein [Actinomycetota bacterium]